MPMKDIESLCRKRRMSCWVVPAIAAELWGVTVGRVMAGVLDGTVDSRTEHGFVFVNVSSDVHGFSHGFSTRARGEPAPPTYVVVRREPEDAFPTLYDQAVVSAPEALMLGRADAAVDLLAPFDSFDPFDGAGWLQALADEMLGAYAVHPGGEAEPEVDSHDPELPPLDEEEDTTPLPPRDAMRAAVGRLRKPPPRPREQT
jgi:hypothetical protein